MGLSDDIQRKRRSNDIWSLPVLAGVLIFQGAAVGVTAAREMVPAGHASAVKLIGVARERYDNRTGATGAIWGTAEKTTFQAAITGATPAVIGNPVYAVDDNTFTMTNSGALLVVGTLAGVDADGTFWIKTN